MISQISYYVRRNQLYKSSCHSKWMIIFGILLGFFILLSQSNLAFANHCKSNEYLKYITDYTGYVWHRCIPITNFSSPGGGPTPTPGVRGGSSPPPGVVGDPHGPCAGGMCHEVLIIGDTIIIFDNILGFDSMTILKDGNIISQGPRLEHIEVMADDNVLSIVQMDNADGNAIMRPSLSIKQDIENNSLTILREEKIIFQKIYVNPRKNDNFVPSFQNFDIGLPKNDDLVPFIRDSNIDLPQNDNLVPFRNEP